MRSTQRRVERVKLAPYIPALKRRGFTALVINGIRSAQPLSLKIFRAQCSHALTVLVPLSRKVHAVWDQRIHAGSAQWQSSCIVEYALDILSQKKARNGALIGSSRGAFEKAKMDTIICLVEQHPEVFGKIVTQMATPQAQEYALLESAKKQLFNKIFSANVLSSTELGLLATVFS